MGVKKEVSQAITPVTATNSGVEVDSLYFRRLDGKSEKPLIVQTLGTLVGSDSAGDDGRGKYGTILRPSIFNDPLALKGALKEIPCVMDSGRDEVTTLAAAYNLKLPNTTTSFYINKQGKYFANIDASTAIDQAGAGESAEINLVGHAKVFIGQNVNNLRSLTLNTEGGVASNWGFDKVKGRSWDATFRKAVSWNILGQDSDNIAWKTTVQGDVTTIISGNRFTEVKGNDIRLVHGVIEDRLFGKKVDNFLGDKATSYGGALNETVIGHSSKVLSAGRTTSIIAPDLASGQTYAEKTKILAGNSELSLALGSRKESIVAGTHETTVIAGKYSVNVYVGTYTVAVKAGLISISTLAGNVSIGTKVGLVTVSGTLGVTLKSAVQVKADCPKAKIGMLPQAGVVTSFMPCYLTGTKHIGSRTVTCNMI